MEVGEGAVRCGGKVWNVLTSLIRHQAKSAGSAPMQVLAGSWTVDGLYLV